MPAPLLFSKSLDYRKLLNWASIYLGKLHYHKCTLENRLKVLRDYTSRTLWLRHYVLKLQPSLKRISERWLAFAPIGEQIRSIAPVEHQQRQVRRQEFVVETSALYPYIVHLTTLFQSLHQSERTLHDFEKFHELHCTRLNNLETEASMKQQRANSYNARKQAQIEYTRAHHLHKAARFDEALESRAYPLVNGFWILYEHVCHHSAREQLQNQRPVEPGKYCAVNTDNFSSELDL